MNSPVSSAPSSPRGACTTSAGPGAECVAAAGQDRITAVPARSPLSPASSTDSHKDLATEPVSGREIARWPDFFLELVLCWLRPCDLARCSRVCRQWYRVAGSVELQARSFSRTCPRLQQQWLQQAQDAEGVRQSLASWCERLAWGSHQRTQLEELVIRGLSFRGFFYVLLQHRLCAERFADSRHDTADAGRGRVRQLVCSPDSRYLAASLFLSLADNTMSVRLWQHRPGAGLEAVGVFHSESWLDGLMFSADSRSLQAVDGRGQLQFWQRLACGFWQQAAPRPLCRQPVLRVICSPDRHHLALVSATAVTLSVWLTGQGWQQQWHWTWNHSPQSSAPVSCVFSEDGRCFFFLSGSTLMACHRVDARWHMQPLHFSFPIQARPVTDPGGRWLALGLVTGGVFDAPEAFASGERHVQLYRLEDTGRWQFVTSRPCWDNRRHAFPLAFSPDGQLLALPDDSVREDRLCLLSTRSPRNGRRGLAIGRPGWMRERVPGVLAFQFSPAGHCLAATTLSSVHIWQRQGARDWVAQRSLMMFSAQGLQGRGFAFSPDGHHDAFVDQGVLHVWGTGRDGRRREKLRWLNRVSVRCFTFTPDATRLVAICCPAPSRRDSIYQLHCLTLVPEEALADTLGTGLERALSATDAATDSP